MAAEAMAAKAVAAKAVAAKAVLGDAVVVHACVVEHVRMGEHAYVGEDCHRLACACDQHALPVSSAGARPAASTWTFEPARPTWTGGVAVEPADIAGGSHRAVCQC